MSRGHPLCYNCGLRHPSTVRCAEARKAQGAHAVIEMPKVGATLEPAAPRTGTPHAPAPSTGVTVTQNNEPPKVTPEGALQRITTAIGAPFRVVTNGPIDVAVAYAVLYILLFVLLVAICSWGCTSAYTIGHGWFGWFGCPNEVLVVQPYDGPTRKDMLKQDGGEQ